MKKVGISDSGTAPREGGGAVVQYGSGFQGLRSDPHGKCHSPLVSSAHLSVRGPYITSISIDMDVM
jgi:hypothetical protein